VRSRDNERDGVKQRVTEVRAETVGKPDSSRAPRWKPNTNLTRAEMPELDFVSGYQRLDSINDVAGIPP
jgi:hypothetical protein